MLDVDLSKDIEDMTDEELVKVAKILSSDVNENEVMLTDFIDFKFDNKDAIEELEKAVARFWRAVVLNYSNHDCIIRQNFAKLVGMLGRIECWKLYSKHVDGLEYIDVHVVDVEVLIPIIFTK